MHDIQTVANRRNPYVQLILHPAQVQGEGAAESIVFGIRSLEQRDVDVIIVGRGGGSIEDLWAFNEESVARAIFDCTVPIISAVGHETDFTIADYVADRRAPTPSAAAELAVFDLKQTVQQIDSIRLTLNRGIGPRLEAAEAKIRQYRTELTARSPKNRLIESRHRAADGQTRLQNRMEQILSDKRQRLKLAAGALEERSPLKKLESGYAFLASPDGKRIRSAAELTGGDRIRAWLTDGSFTATVDEVSLEKKKDSSGSDQ